jgi:glucosamine--fructose-6-phosphate aminotransferase (isomerizing)
MLSAALSDKDELRQALKAVPDQVSWTLRQAEFILAAAAEYRDAAACVTIGRGYNYATAFEIALKLKELTYILAEPYSSADFQHGPVAIVQDGFLVLAIVPEGKTASELTRFAKNLRARGARLAVIAAKSRALSLGNSAFWLPRGLPEWLSPIAAVVPGQLFALGLAQARGLDPDKPRGLSKVTRTR